MRAAHAGGGQAPGGGRHTDRPEREGAKRVIQAIEQNKNFVQYRGVQIARKGC